MKSGAAGGGGELDGRILWTHFHCDTGKSHRVQTKRGRFGDEELGMGLLLMVSSFLFFSK